MRATIKPSVVDGPLLTALDSTIPNELRELGLIAIYEPDLRLGSAVNEVRQLEDTSGHSNTLVQIVESRRPVAIKSSILSSVWCQAIAQQALRTIVQVDLTGGFTVCFAGVVDAESADYGLLACEDGDGANTVLDICLDYAAGGLELTSNRDGTQKQASSSGHKIRAGRHFFVTLSVSGAASVELRARGVDLTPTETGTGSYLPSSSRLLLVGEAEDSGDHWEGEILGVYISSPALSTSDRATLEEYVAARLPDYARDAALLNAPDASVPMQDYAAPIASPTGHTVTPSGSLTYGADCPAIGAPLALTFAGSERVDVAGVKPPEAGDHTLEMLVDAAVATEVLADWTRPGGLTGYSILTLASSGYVSLSMNDGTATFSATSTKALGGIGWAHLVAVVDRSTDMATLYVDGVEFLSIDVSAMTSVVSNNDILGLGARGATFGLNGSMAAASVHVADLTEAEIRARYRLAMGDLYTDAAAPLGAVHAWDVDPDGLASDLAGSASLVLTAASTPGAKTPLGCGVPWAVEGDGTDAIGSVAHADLDVDFDGDFSIVVLVSPDTTPASRGHASKATALTAVGWSLVSLASGTKTYWKINGSSLGLTTATIFDGGWHMLAARVSGSTRSLVHHWSGGVEAIEDTTPAGTRANTEDMLVGRSRAFGTETLIGSIAAPMLFDRALSDLELRSIWRRFARGDGLTYVPDSAPSLLTVNGGADLLSVNAGADNLLIA